MFESSVLSVQVTAPPLKVADVPASASTEVTWIGAGSVTVTTPFATFVTPMAVAVRTTSNATPELTVSGMSMLSEAQRSSRTGHVVVVVASDGAEHDQRESNEKRDSSPPGQPH